MDYNHCCKSVKIMFKKHYTKWKPLGKFTFSGKEYITLIRKNRKTGMLKFKTIRVNGFFGAMGYVNTFLPSNLIDTQKAWNEAISRFLSVGISITKTVMIQLQN